MMFQREGVEGEGGVFIAFFQELKNQSHLSHQFLSKTRLIGFATFSVCVKLVSPGQGTKPED
jgi:hypothetical protein